jgi:hypothetical protein
MYMSKLKTNTYYIDTRNFRTDEQAEIADIIDDIRGWAGLGYRFRRVYDRSSHPDIVIVKLSRSQMLRRFAERPDLHGLSVTSRGANGSVIYIDDTNWRQVPANFYGSRQTYRQYLVQHEIGHCLGFEHVPASAGHSRCPVMYQQTRGTITCRANPWSNAL